jgi:hypothetical protein
VGLDGVYPVVVDAGLGATRAAELFEALVAGGYFRSPVDQVGLRAATFNAGTGTVVSTRLTLTRQPSGALSAHLRTAAVRLPRVDWRDLGSPEVRSDGKS